MLPEQSLTMKTHMLSWLVCTLMVFAALVGHAEEFDFGGQDIWLAEEEEFLKVDEAFILSASLGREGEMQVRWDMPEGYYLYRHQFAFQTRNPGQLQLGEAQIPPGKAKHDEYFGDVEVYYRNAQALVPLTKLSNSVDTEIGITFQGCADAGLCYPPETKWFSYNGERLIQTSLLAESAASEPGADESTPSSESKPVVADTEEELLAGALAGESLWYALGLFFIAGIGLAFTPCVLPMVPILSSIIVGEGENIGKGRALSLSLAYVLGMAATYAAVGTLVGLFGAELNLQAALQSPPVLVFFAIIFVLLSLAMFGLYELQLPNSWQNRLNAIGQQQKGGKHASVAVMGAVSSLVVSPCVSAPLAGALIYISTTSDAVLGGTALLALGLGMGVPLLLVGGSGGHWLPRAGEWMNGVKAVFGVLLLGVAVWLVERIVAPAVTLALWGALLMGSGVYLGVLDFSPREGVAQLGKAAGTMAFLWGVLLLIGAASGANNPLQPLAQLTGGGATYASASGAAAVHEEQAWLPVKTVADVERRIAQSDGLVILDLYADWCISCKTMERDVFPEAEVARQLGRFTLLRADVTANDDQDRALLSEYGLFGPPSLVFFGEDGREIADVRIQGEVTAGTLSAHLQAVLGAYEA